ncbi:signal peptidase I [Candidatus Roizmanbacteria bacterium]|nr:signal peptidase I [Candidatus Roizmanbacteria bacterium]
MTFSKIVLYDWGITNRLTKVPVSGTSMLPTIQDGVTITLNSPKKYGIARGDIVSFQNIETSGMHYLKRVIGVAGEEVSIVNGSVMINKVALKEDYIYQHAPTYGNTFLTDCEIYKIPKDHVMVMGDNRIVSVDSRIVGFVALKDIDGVIKTDVAPEFGSPMGIRSDSETTIDPTTFVQGINSLREKEEDLDRLRSNPILNQIAGRRATIIATNLDSWKQHESSVTTLMNEFDYEYLQVNEMVTYGTLSEKDLVAQIQESPLYKSEFLSKQYYEVGVGVTDAEKGQCRFPVISVVLAMPTNPSYSDDTVNMWRRDIEVISTIISALQDLKFNSQIDQQEAQILIDELSTLLTTATQMRSLVEKNQWLTEGEYKAMEEYRQQSEKTRVRLQSFYERYNRVITDPKVKEQIQKLLPGDTEYNEQSTQTKLLFSQGKYTEQKDAAEKLLELAASDYERAIGYYWRGLAYYKLGNSTKAKEDLLMAVSLDATYAGPYVTLSAIEFDAENYQQGLTYAQKCVELDPEYAWCHNNLGLAYWYLGQEQRAISSFEKAVSLDPSSFTFNDNLKRAKEN